MFAWRKVVDPANASEYAFFLYPLKNAEAINAAKCRSSRSACARSTTRRSSSTSNTRRRYFEKLVAYGTYGPIRQDFYESITRPLRRRRRHDAVQRTVQITTWVHGAHLRLEKNPYYWDADRIKLNVIDIPVRHERSARSPESVQGRQDRDRRGSELPKRSTTRSSTVWQINRFNDGSRVLPRIQSPPGARHAQRESAQGAAARDRLRRTRLQGDEAARQSARAIVVSGLAARRATVFFAKEYPAGPQRVDVAEARRYLALAKQELGVDTMPPLVLLTDDEPGVEQAGRVLSRTSSNERSDLDVKIDKQIFKQRLAKMTAGEFDMVGGRLGSGLRRPADVRRSVLVVEQEQSRPLLESGTRSPRAHRAEFARSENADGRVRRDPEDPASTTS